MRPQPTSFFPLLFVLALVASACGLSRSESAQAELPPLQTEVDDNGAALITFADGSTATVPAAEVEDIVNQLKDNPDAAQFLFDRVITDEFSTDVLTALIQVRVLDQTIAEVGGEVAADAGEKTMALLDQQLDLAMAQNPDGSPREDPEGAAIAIRENASLYLSEVIVAQRIRQDAITAQFVTEVPCVRHILVETEGEANDLIAQLADGSDFAELAVQFSTGPSGPDGGDLGCSDPAGFVAPFAEAIQAGSPNTILGPVETEFGFHVIEIYDTGLPNADGSAAAEQEGFAVYSEVLSAAEVTVDERYGSWNAEAGLVEPPVVAPTE